MAPIPISPTSTSCNTSAVRDVAFSALHPPWIRGKVAEEAHMGIYLKKMFLMHFFMHFYKGSHFKGDIFLTVQGFA